MRECVFFLARLEPEREYLSKNTVQMESAEYFAKGTSLKAFADGGMMDG